jgi:hypothetical protein
VRSIRSSVVLVGLLLALAATTAAAQDSEEFAGPGGTTLSGYTRSDGTVVLDDASFCRFLLGSVWGDRKVTDLRLLDKSKAQKKARAGAFEPGSDEAALARCVATIRAFQTAPAEGEAVPAWAQLAPVIPESLAGLLPPDWVTHPLAQPEQVGAGARTTGHGDVVSAPFSLTGGPWLAQVDAAACSVWSGVLRDARDPSITIPLVEDRAYLYTIEAGHYYWDVTASDCDWSVDLVPVELGPVPTPTPTPRAIVPNLIGVDWDNHTGAANPTWLTAAQAREAVLAAGLVSGECHTDSGGRRRDRVWRQEPVAGTLADFGSAVDVWIAQDCDVYSGQRVVLP